MNNLHSYFDARKSTNFLEKLAVAKHIHNHMLRKLDPVFMDGGSAVASIAKEMAEGDKGHFTVVTNNVRALLVLMENRTIRVIVTGGFYVTEDEALVGKSALLDYQLYSYRFAIVGASAINPPFVYNHGIMGEEEIKKNYWGIPAQELIIPACLDKFGRKDLICFGTLMKEHAKTGEPVDTNRNVQEIVTDELEDVQKKQQFLQDGNFPASVKGFGANKCTIVVEPKWMIEKNPAFERDPEYCEQLLQMVENINKKKHFTKVEVIFSQVSEKEIGRTLKTRFARHE